MAMVQLETSEELLRQELEPEVCSPCGQEVWEQALGEAAKGQQGQVPSRCGIQNTYCA